MGLMRIGILGAADIAKRRFLPALKKSEIFQFAGVAVSDVSRVKKAEELTSIYGGKIYIGYEELLRKSEIDAVYIPQPPAFHNKWARLAISYGKHVLLEKPATTNLQDAEALIAYAEEKNIALLENYGFCYHRQAVLVKSIIEREELGKLRLVRAAFGFPYRDCNDFRYHAALGGGALLDCGGYTVKAVQLLLGNRLKVMASQLNYEDIHDVDLFGSVMLCNEKGLTAQVSFGMDNSYRCELEIWGSEGYLSAPRFFTPPADFEAEIFIKKGMEEQTIKVEADDQFLCTIQKFSDCIKNSEIAREAREEILCQMKLIQAIQTENQ